MPLKGLAKDSALAAFVALILAIPLVGLNTVERDGRIVVETRFSWVAIAVVAVFVGRLLLGLVPRRQKQATDKRPLAALLDKHARRLGWCSLAGLVIWPFLPFSSTYLVDLASNILTYILLGWGLNIVVGLAGLLNLGYAGFYAVGAYTFGIAAQSFGLGFWEALPLAGLLAAAVGILLGFPVLRLRGDYLAIVTLGFGEIIRIILINWSSLTSGPNGITDVPRPTFFGMPLTLSAP